ncbi:MAG: hypothetical protein ACM30D_16205, partial [Hyphomicrobiales bacterium]
RQDACVAATPVGKPSATDEAASRLNFRRNLAPRKRERFLRHGKSLEGGKMCQNVWPRKE